MGLKPDSEGRMLQEIQKWDFETLENIHNYIQWLFPLNEVSSANHRAPILTRQDIAEFKTSKIIKNNLIVSFEVMLSFYGFEVLKNDSNISISIANSFDVRSKNWLRRHNHNFLRLTRIIKCLKLSDLDNYAQALFNVLQTLFHSDFESIIGKETYRYWHNATNA